MSFARFLPLVMLGFVSVAPLQGYAQTGGVAPMLGQSGDSLSRLTDVLQIGEVVGIMREEGLDYGRQLEEELFPRRGGGSWNTLVDLIYEPAAMRRQFDAAFTAELADDPASVSAILGFFDTDAGKRILALEIEARRSLMDPAIEEAARARVEDMQADGDRRILALIRFAEVNDLIDSNVAGALNANLAFFQGMSEAGSLDGDMTQEQMLSEVWGQEPDIRAETEGWLMPYLALAYGPLSDEEVDAYIAFSETEPGQKLNHALFAAFDKLFTGISRDLGRAAGRQLSGEDI